METADREWSHVRPRAARRRTGAAGGRVELGETERRRLVQLVVCLCLFAVCFVGKHTGAAGWRGELLGLMRDGGELSAVFSRAGESLANGKTLGHAAEELWVQVFGSADLHTRAGTQGSVTRRELETLSGGARLGLMGEEAPCAVRMGQAPPEPAQAAAEPVEEPQVVHVDYAGPALPDNTTMDRYRLALAETVTPVMGGWMSSAFGWREHPLDGEESFHNGVDLAVNTGTEVRAFADGVVDYIGESEVYGKYLQLIHADGVTTFYAHCDKLCVQKGQTVAAGERVALSGDTGRSTGPHLHFELKRDGVRLNPAYYISIN